MKKQKVSNAVIRRLPRYYRHLTDLSQAGVQRISSSALGTAMNLTASQIRQDLSCFGEFGQQGYGYNVESLRNEVADILGMTREHTAIILGVGNLGRALIENFRGRTRDLRYQDPSCGGVGAISENQFHQRWSPHSASGSGPGHGGGAGPE